jgi:hypothetical protein
MGRGLSDLQRYILHEAGKRARVYHAEVMAGFFGFPSFREMRHDEDGMSAQGRGRRLAS